MRAKLFVVCAIVVAGLSYIALPFYTAWSIRDAVKTGKADVLAATVNFASVKVSLKDSLHRLTATRPQLTSADAPSGAAKPQKPGLWARMKSAVTRSVVDRMVDRYGTPEGFGQMFSYGQIYRTQLRGLEDPEANLSHWDKVQHVWARIKRAEFKSWSRFELDMIDKFEANRIYSGVLTLTATGWKLTELRVFDQGPRQIVNAAAMAR